ncbi:Mitogen-activated protein kinase kinase kinase [Handroanthus impetiginosus]|uniref:Mitogen-activated protein kinase kinase kinase n=1 Tax=Handroanthus impetiginosus TaxID=429701 RepID=A0A2G9FWA5_9LAMI|nr:Mitogen-activated protein kinase kinase kinase [Handroanthus impetiginosus]
MYLSPEAVIDKVQEAPCDIWALGCIVLEMLTGKPPWDVESESKKAEVLGKIGKGNELPKIPSTISKEAKDFLKGCFVRKTAYRLTTEMLLNHAFVEGLDDDDGNDDDEDVGAELEDAVVSESDDEWGYGCSADKWDSLSSSYEEESELICNSCEENEGVIGSSIESGSHISKQSLSERRRHYPVSFTITAGI